jgi:Golgi SNAP receptor complex protein 1
LNIPIFSIAIGVKENLNRQRSAISAINMQLNQIGKKYPQLANVMRKIQFKKRKDTIILASVIVGCLIFMFLFVMR